MSEKNKLKKLNKHELLKGLIFSIVILLLIVIVGYSIKTKPMNIWAAVIVVNLCVALLWLVVRLGGFTFSSRGTRKLGNSFRDRKVNKLGVYQDENEKKKKAKSISEIEEDNRNKSKQGIYLMFAISLIEVISTIYLFV